MTDKKVRPTTSPTESPGAYVVETGRMDFFDALRQVLAGEKVTKIEWGDYDIYLVLDGERLKIMLADGKLHPLLVSEGDMAGTDWVVL